MKYFLDTNNPVGGALFYFVRMAEISEEYVIKFDTSELRSSFGDDSNLYDIVNSNLDRKAGGRIFEGNSHFSGDMPEKVTRCLSENQDEIRYLDLIEVIEGDETVCRIEFDEYNGVYTEFKINEELADFHSDFLEEFNSEPENVAQILPRWRMKWESRETKYVFGGEYLNPTTICTREDRKYFDLREIKDFEENPDELMIKLKYPIHMNILGNILKPIVWLIIRESDLRWDHRPQEIYFDERERMEKFSEILELINNRRERLVLEEELGRS
ncbi:MAG: hypothetical protein ABEJ56_01650 [Candidatus Nanohaloarchaea archaeon]